MFRYTVYAGAIALALGAAPAAVLAQQPSASDAAYIAKVTTAAPAAVASGATIVEMQKDGTMRTVQAGTNGFTCLLLDPTTPMCADKNAMAWMQALLTHAAPPNTMGFVYMLAGDSGASNSDPYARTATSENHWVKTGPHVMIVGSPVKGMGYPMTMDPDASKPYVMWPDTQYAHLMLPVGTQQ